MTYTFKGGSRVVEHKNTKDSPIEKLPAPKMVAIPLSQHIGAPCSPCVNAGDEVKVGQIIGDSEAFVSAKVHSTVSGKVKAIEPRLHPNGTKVMSVVVENDFPVQHQDTSLYLLEIKTYHKV